MGGDSDSSWNPEGDTDEDGDNSSVSENNGEYSADGKRASRRRKRRARGTPAAKIAKGKRNRRRRRKNHESSEEKDMSESEIDEVDRGHRLGRLRRISDPKEESEIKVVKRKRKNKTRPRRAYNSRNHMRKKKRDRMTGSADDDSLSDQMSQKRAERRQSLRSRRIVAESSDSESNQATSSQRRQSLRSRRIVTVSSGNESSEVMRGQKRQSLRSRRIVAESSDESNEAPNRDKTAKRTQRRRSLRSKRTVAEKSDQESDEQMNLDGALQNDGSDNDMSESANEELLRRQSDNSKKVPASTGKLKNSACVEESIKSRKRIIRKSDKASSSRAHERKSHVISSSGESGGDGKVADSVEKESITSDDNPLPPVRKRPRRRSTIVIESDEDSEAAHHAGSPRQGINTHIEGQDYDVDDEMNEEGGVNFRSTVCTPSQTPPITPRQARTRYTLRSSEKMRSGRKSRQLEKALSEYKKRRTSKNGLNNHDEQAEQESNDDSSVILMDSMRTLYRQTDLKNFIVNDENGGDDENGANVVQEEDEEDEEDYIEDSKISQKEGDESDSSPPPTSRRVRKKEKKLPKGVKINESGLMELGQDYFESGDDIELVVEDDEHDADEDLGQSSGLERELAHLQFQKFLEETRKRFDTFATKSLDAKFAMESKDDSRWLSTGLMEGILSKFPESLTKLISEYAAIPMPQSDLLEGLKKCIKRNDFAYYSTERNRSKIARHAKEWAEKKIIGSKEGRKSIEECTSKFIPDRTIANIFDDIRSMIEIRQFGASAERKILKDYIPFDIYRNKAIHWSICSGEVSMKACRGSYNDYSDFDYYRQRFFDRFQHLLSEKKSRKAKDIRPSQVRAALDGFQEDVEGDDHNDAMKRVRNVSRMFSGLTAKAARVARDNLDECVEMLECLKKLVCGVCQKYPRVIMYKATIPDFDKRGEVDNVDVVEPSESMSPQANAHRDESDSDEYAVPEGNQSEPQRRRGRRMVVVDGSDSSEESVVIVAATENRAQPNINEHQDSNEEVDTDRSESSFENESEVGDTKVHGPSVSLDVGACCVYKMTLSIQMMTVVRGLFMDYHLDYLEEDARKALYQIVAEILMHYNELLRDINSHTGVLRPRVGFPKNRQWV